MRVFVPVKPNPTRMGPHVREALIRALGDAYARLEGPVVLRVRFIFKRAQNDRHAAPTLAPSVGALTRAVLDELAGEAYLDERQVVALHVGKEYGNVNAIEVRW